MHTDEIKSGVEKLGPWFHRVALPGGILTKETDNFGEGADHPLPTWSHVSKALPEDLSGKSVLDVGCNAGFYSFEAAARGASRVFGCDAVRWHVRQARFAAKARGESRVEFDRVSLYELDPATHGTFDVVLALGLVYHLKYLIEGLQTLFSVTNDLLILESAVVDAAGDFEAGQPEPMPRANDQVYYLGYAKNSPFEKESALNWFFPTPAALKAMVEDVGFVDVQIVDVFNNRCVISARKPSHPIDSHYPAYLRAEIEIVDELQEVSAGETINLQLVLRNTGRAAWRVGAEGDRKGAVGVYASITSDEDPVFGEDHPALFLEHSLNPGETVSLTYGIPAPKRPGKYLLELDLISEQVALFQDVGSRTTRHSIVVV